MKKQRQNKITEIINNNRIETQEELIGRLADSGIETTQATLSRDMRELRIRKQTDPDGSSYYAVVEKRLADPDEMLITGIVSSDHAMNTVVLRCHTGMAQAVCARFDRMKCADVVGTLAGDDTIFILMRTENDAMELSAEFEELSGNEV